MVSKRDKSGPLDRICREHGKTLYEVAKESGIKRGSIYYYDDNPGRIPCEELSSIAASLKIPEAEIGALLKRLVKK